MSERIVKSHASPEKPRKSAVTIFLFAAVIIAALGFLGYKMYLVGEQKKQEAELAAAEQEKIRLQQIEAKRQDLLNEASKLAEQYYYDEAVSLLSNVDEEIIDDKISVAKASFQAQKDALVKYSGPIYHIFFHSLIIYPELAFDNKGHPAQGYNMWMTTQSEFQKMLPLLYNNGFLLYDLESLITRNGDGTISQSEIYLPEGKKPLIISVDDVCYYDYMKTDGFANRLVINENNEVVTEVISPDGTVSLTKDGDVMPILDEFVENHPDFSYRGAKGVIAVTGYQGALGYRITDLEGDELKEAQQTVSDIAANLRSNGWKFACHSYTHNGYFRDGSITMDELISDTTRWKKLIEPYVGETKIYISPFGVHFAEKDERYQYILSNGFDIYCGVSNTLKTTFYNTSMMQERFDMDGYMMFKKPEYIAKYYFNVEDVIDQARPALK